MEKCYYLLGKLGKLSNDEVMISHDIFMKLVCDAEINMTDKIICNIDDSTIIFLELYNDHFIESEHSM